MSTMPQVTLMRTTPEENDAIGPWIVERLNRMEGPVRFLLPLRAFRPLMRGQPFHDPEADAALFAAIRASWVAARNRKLIEVDAHINDPAFAEAAVAAFRDILKETMARAYASHHSQGSRRNGMESWCVISTACRNGRPPSPGRRSRVGSMP